MAAMPRTFDAIELLMRYETPRIKDMERDDDVLEWVAAFVGSDLFLDVIDAFCDAHGAQFTALIETGAELASSEMPSSWPDLHAEFLQVTNDAIEGFLTANGFSMDQYRQRCEQELQRSQTRQRHTRLSFFVQLLMACCEYEQFLNLMRRAADPEYYDKQDLQYQAELIVFNASNEATAQATPKDEQQRQAAQEFLEFARQNPCATLEEMTQEFQAKLRLA